MNINSLEGILSNPLISGDEQMTITKKELSEFVRYHAEKRQAEKREKQRELKQDEWRSKELHKSMHRREFYSSLFNLRNGVSFATMYAEMQFNRKLCGITDDEIRKDIHHFKGDHKYLVQENDTLRLTTW